MPDLSVHSDVASDADFATQEAINNAAVKALYHTKHESRNQAILATLNEK